MIFFGALSKFTKTFFSVHVTMSSIKPGVPISTGLYVDSSTQSRFTDFLSMEAAGLQSDSSCVSYC